MLLLCQTYNYYFSESKPDYVNQTLPLKYKLNELRYLYFENVTIKSMSKI